MLSTLPLLVWGRAFSTMFPRVITKILANYMYLPALYPNIAIPPNGKSLCPISLSKALLLPTLSLANGTLTVRKADDNSIVDSGSQVEHGTMLKIEATPAAGYHLSKIEVNGKTITDTQIVVKEATNINVEFALGTGIDHSEHTALGIYPTPAGEFITVEAEVGSSPVSITITDLSGRVVATATTTGNKTVVNVSHLSAGTYIIRVGDKVGKVVKW